MSRTVGRSEKKFKKRDCGEIGEIGDFLCTDTHGMEIVLK
jgi:hypothetical protein